MDVDCGSARDRLGRALGKYRLDAILGAGGTAVVYRASTPDGCVVAVKVLHDHLRRSRPIRRRFLREGEIGAMLHHPGVVRVFDRGATDEGAPYLVLEHLDGESLEERRVRAGGRLDLRDVLEHADALLVVLELAHTRGVIHRDIKPSNLFLTRSGMLKVLDFGVARHGDSPTSTKNGQTVGTPAFMSPEQALSRPHDVDARADLWSVGATLFTLLSGEHVHLADGTAEHLVKAATAAARSLAAALPSAPPEVVAFVARSLAFDKRDRFPSATAMRAALARLRGASVRARAQTTDTPSTEFLSRTNVVVDRPAGVRPRSPRGVILGVAAVALLGAAAVAITLRPAKAPLLMSPDTASRGAAALAPPPPKPVVLDAPAEDDPPAPPRSSASAGPRPPPRVAPKLDRGSRTDVYRPF